MSKQQITKNVFEVVTECHARGRIEEIEVYMYASNEKLGTFDRHDVMDAYYDRLVLKHRRNRINLKLWIV